MTSATPGDSSLWRAEIEKGYGRPLPDETWEWLEGEHYIAELEEGGSVTVDYVVDKIRSINAAAPAARARSARRVLEAGSSSESLFAGLNTRLQAQAEVIAWRAARSTTVVAFRQRWLGDGLITADAVTGWIDKTYHAHRPRKWPSEPGPSQATNVRGRFALWPHTHLALEWLDTEEGTTRVWCVPTRGPLAELARLSTTLAEQWDWDPPLATNFVLTGETPARPGVRGVSFRTRRGSGVDGGYQFMSVRCVIDVETTPEQLAAWWRGVRTAIGISGRKPMGEKAVRLALFALASDDESTTFAQAMEQWNAHAPEEWRYHDYRNFRTAAFAAVEALNNPAAECRLP